MSKDAMVKFRAPQEKKDAWFAFAGKRNFSKWAETLLDLGLKAGRIKSCDKPATPERRP